MSKDFLGASSDSNDCGSGKASGSIILVLDMINDNKVVKSAVLWTSSLCIHRILIL